MQDYFFEKKKLIIFGETYTNTRRIIPLLGSRGEDKLQMASYLVHQTFGIMFFN